MLSVFRDAVTAAPLGVWEAEKGRYRLIPASIEPLIIKDELWNSLQDDAHRILSGLQKLGTRVRFGGDQLAPLEKQPADFAGLATARLDLFFDGDDLLVIEANTTIPAMQAYSDMIREAYFKAFHQATSISSSNTQDLLESLLQHYERTGGRKSQPRVAIVARAGDSQLAELLWLQTAWTRMGYETRLVTPDELSIKGGQLWTAAQPMDLIYRHIFAHRLAPQSDFAQACLQAERFRIFNPIAAHLEAKGLLAELSRYAADPILSRSVSLDDAERDAIQRRVVWSRLLSHGPATLPDGSLEKNLVAWVKDNARDLVVKSSLGYGGHGVFIGSSFQEAFAQDRARTLLGVTGDVSWSTLIDQLLSRGNQQWIIQKRVSGRKMRHRFFKDGQIVEAETFVDCSIFTNSGVAMKPRGGASRFSTDAIVNIGQGGGLMPLLLESEHR